MKFVLLLGPQTVGKMTIGQELEQKTGMKLFHNHQTIDLLHPYFDFTKPAHHKLKDLIRREMFKEMAVSDLEGVILYVFVPVRRRRWRSRIYRGDRSAVRRSRCRGLHH